MKKTNDTVKKLMVANGYYRSQVNNLFTEIDKLSGDWGGKDNTAFNNRITSYKGDMYELAGVIDDFVDFLNSKDDFHSNIPNDEDADILRTINQNLDETLSSVSKIMLELHDEWKDEGEAVVTKFQKLANRFIDESETIEQYARFLDWYFLSREDNNG